MGRTRATKAIILRVIEHGDRSVVLKALTEGSGPSSFLVRPRVGKVPRNLLQPLMRVELVVTDDPGRELQHVQELRLDKPYTGLHRDPMRAVVGVFVQEVLYQALRGDAPDPALFSYVELELDHLDQASDPEDLPIRFLLGLAWHLGIFPAQPQPNETRYDPQEGRFFSGIPPHAACFDPACSTALAAWLRSWPERPVGGDRGRRALLDGLLEHFRYHVPGFGTLRSPDMLRAVLH